MYDTHIHSEPNILNEKINKDMYTQKCMCIVHVNEVTTFTQFRHKSNNTHVSGTGFVEHLFDI